VPNSTHIERIKLRNDLYEQYLHDVVIPLAQMFKICKASCQFRDCGVHKKIEKYIDKGSVIMTKINQIDQGDKDASN
jgi:hypothetical protein